MFRQAAFHRPQIIRVVARRQSLVARVAPFLLLASGLAFLTVCLGILTKHWRQPLMVAAENLLEAWDKPGQAMASESTFEIGRQSYQVLGLSRDFDSNRPVVWLRSLRTNRVDRFAAGESVFGSQAYIAHIGDHRLTIKYHEKSLKISLPP